MSDYSTENNQVDETNMENIPDITSLLDKKSSREIELKKKKHSSKAALEENVIVKYLYSNAYNYSIYEDNLCRNGKKLCKIRNKEDIEDAFILDLFCKLWTFYYSEKCKSGHCGKNNLETKTPHKLKKEKYISSGRYSDWKKYASYSVIEEAYGVNNDRYVLCGIKELLDNPTMCILILFDCVENKKISNKDSLWSVIEKVITSYTNGEKTICLSEKEKKRIVSILTTESDTDEVISWEESIQERSKRKDKDEKKKQKEKMKELSLTYRPELKRLDEEIRNKNNIIINKIENNPNAHNQKMFFCSYLSPIVAGICDNYENAQNLLFINKPICTTSIPYQKIEGEGVSSDMMQNYAILKRFSEFVEELNHIMDNETEEKILMKYETICNAIIYKIISYKNPLAKEYWFVQFYAMEQLMHFQLIENIVDLFCNNLEKYKNDLYRGKMENYVLVRVLEKSNDYYSVFTKNRSVGIVLEELLDKFEKNSDENSEVYHKYIEKASKKMKRLDNRLWKKEKCMIKTDKEEVIQALMNSEEIKSKVLKGLYKYTQRADLLEEEDKKTEYFSKGGRYEKCGIPPKKIEAISKEIIQKETTERRKIKFWVIKCILMRQLYPEIKYDL